MKTLIRRVSYKTGERDNSSDWFMWDETCDRCGKPTESKDTDENDYCMACLREIIAARRTRCDT